MLTKSLIFLLLICFSISTTHSQENKKKNVCSTYYGYLAPNIFKNCHHSDDLFDSIPNISRRYTEKSETHYALTEDGYNLTIYRIPHSKPKGVIVMKHASIFCDSSLYLTQENNSLAVVLWQKGYDIWLTNERGTKYSLKHKTLTSEDKLFWNYTVNEIGLYDVKANLDYIKKKTGGKKLIVLDYSTAFTSTMIYASERPKEALDNIKIVIALGPVAYLAEMRPVFGGLAYLTPIFQVVRRITGRDDIFRYNKNLANFMVNNRFKYPFQILKSLAFGWTPFETDPSYFNLFWSQMPSGTSWKNTFHFSQMVRSGGRFQKYDYGRKNMQYYGSARPPQYDVGKVKVPLYLIYSSSDYISTVRNVNILKSRLPNEAKVYGEKLIRGSSHVDLTYGKHIRNRIYKHIFDMLDRLQT